MSPYRLPRREFLLRALAACSAPMLSQLAYAADGQKPLATADARRAARVVAGYLGSGGLDAARAIGDAYARQMAIEPTEEAIVAAANGTLELIGRAPGDAAAIAAIVQAVRRDFLERRSVELEGWVLSRTEVELCLLLLVPAEN